jgi:hypothetical protein
VPSLEEPITLGDGLIPPDLDSKPGMDANKALESHTASLLQEPTSRDVGPIDCSATRLCAAPCAWRELQIQLNKGDTAPVTACIFGLLGTQLFLVRYQPPHRRHLSGLGTSWRIHGGHVYRFLLSWEFCWQYCSRSYSAERGPSLYARLILIVIGRTSYL